MDLKYLSEHICEELDGAEEYIMKAIELKPMTLPWAKTFMEMASAEMLHANNLYKMYTEYYQKVSTNMSELPVFISEDYQKTVSKYTSKSVKIKSMIDMFVKNIA